MFLYKWFTSRKPHTKTDVEEAFQTPCRSGDLKLLKKLVLDKKKPVNSYSKDGFTPLQFTLMNKRHECAIFLLEHGADPNAYYHGRGASYKILWPYIRGNHLADIRLLTIYGANSQGVSFIPNSEAENCFNTTRQLYQKIKPLEDELKKLLKEPGAEQAIAECSTQLAQLWQEVEEAEKQNLDYKNHYKQKVAYYWQMAREPASFIEDTLSDIERPLLTPITPTTP